MDTLKRSQKFCSQCNEKNPIRSFKCKKCGFDFPQKQKKELSSNQQSLLEKFLTKKTQKPMDQYLIESRSTNGKAHVNSLLKQDKIQPSLFTSIQLLYPICSFTLFNSDDDNNNNQSKVIEVIEVIQHKDIGIKLNNSSQCVKFSFDCITSMTNSICIIGFVSKDITQVYYTLIHMSKLSITSKHIFLYNTPIKEDNPNAYYSILVKLITMKPFPFYIIVIDNSLYCICYDHATDQQVQLLTITKTFPITKLDTHYNSKEESIKILLSDSNNNMFYYTFIIDAKAKSFPKLLGVFDNHFQSKITDLKFLNIKEAIADKMTYFAACSRDGVIKIIDVNNTVIFKHKTYQTWITQLFFDYKNDILFFLTNYDDKIVGIKLSIKKEPIIKRVINTNNPLCGLVSDIDDKLYYLDNKGSVFEVKTYLIEDMFKTSKSKKKTEYEPKKINQLEKWEFTKAIKVMNLYDKDTNICLIAYDQLDSLVFTQIETNK